MLENRFDEGEFSEFPHSRMSLDFDAPTMQMWGGEKIRSRAVIGWAIGAILTVCAIGVGILAWATYHEVWQWITR